MTTFAITLPLDRTSPVHIPTRDLALGGTDSGTLLVSVVDRDNATYTDRAKRWHRRFCRLAVRLA